MGECWEVAASARTPPTKNIDNRGVIRLRIPCRSWSEKQQKRATGWPPLWFVVLRLRDLEVVLNREFDYSAIHGIQGFPGSIHVLIAGGQVTGRVRELQVDVGVVIQSVELRQRVIQEVESFKAQLKLLLLFDGEVLVERQIAVE